MTSMQMSRWCSQNDQRPGFDCADQASVALVPEGVRARYAPSGNSLNSKSLTCCCDRIYAVARLSLSESVGAGSRTLQAV